MTDTTHDTTLNRMCWITDRLAYINCGNVPGVTIYEEDELLVELGQLNARFGEDMDRVVAPKRRKGMLRRQIPILKGSILELLGVSGVIALAVILFAVIVSTYGLLAINSHAS